MDQFFAIFACVCIVAWLAWAKVQQLRAQAAEHEQRAALLETQAEQIYAHTVSHLMINKIITSDQAKDMFQLEEDGSAA